MSEKTLLRKVNKLKELEAQKNELEKQMDEIKNEIKEEMKSRGTEEVAVGDWMVRFKAVLSSRFDSKAFALSHPRLYQKYMIPSQTMRFTVQ